MNFFSEVWSQALFINLKSKNTVFPRNPNFFNVYFCKKHIWGWYLLLKSHLHINPEKFHNWIYESHKKVIIILMSILFLPKTQIWKHILKNPDPFLCLKISWFLHKSIYQSTSRTFKQIQTCRVAWYLNIWFFSHCEIKKRFSGSSSVRDEVHFARLNISPGFKISGLSRSIALLNLTLLLGSGYQVYLDLLLY